MKYLSGIDHRFCHFCKSFSHDYCNRYKAEVKGFNWCDNFAPFWILGVASSVDYKYGVLLEKNKENHLFEVGVVPDVSEKDIVGIRNKVRKIAQIESGQTMTALLSKLPIEPDNIYTSTGTTFVQAAELFKH